MADAVNSGLSCLVAFQIPCRSLTALDIRIKGDDVYVNYDTAKKKHISYHASGQRHTKRGKDYVFQFAGPSGRPEPVKHFRPRPDSVEDRENVASIGWRVDSLGEVLPTADRTPDVLIDATGLAPSSSLAIIVDIVGRLAAPLHEIAGYPILKSHRFSGMVTVEIIAFSVPASATT